MWDSFWPQILVEFVGALFGAIATVAIAYGTYLLSRMHRETQALNALISYLNHRRSLAPLQNLRSVPMAEESDDYAQVSSSVLAVRDEVHRTRAEVRPVERLQTPLADMIRACNRYLETSALTPDEYWFHLMELRSVLVRNVGVICSAKRNVRALEPGGGAL